MNLAAPYFSSPCPPCRESCVKATVSDAVHFEIGFPFFGR